MEEKLLGFTYYLLLILELSFLLFLFSFLELTVFPLFQGRPALILDDDGLYVDSVGFKILWTEINSVKSYQTNRIGTVLKIYINTDNIKYNVDSINRNIWIRFNEVLTGTPIIFNATLIKGRPIDLYVTIKNRITIAKQASS
jgi:hypothetical protein